MTQTTRQSTSRTTETTTARRTTPLALGAVAALLALGVAAVHVIDQGGFPGSKDPSYMGLGYYALEAAALVLAVLVLVPRARASALTWALAGGIGLGPIVGYCLSRGPGLPSYTDDRGNWTETLGLVSLALEAALVLVALAGTRRATTER